MNDNQPANGVKIGNEKLIRVTENAARRLSSLLEKQGRPQGALRLAVIGGGCSGLQYKMDLVEGPAPRDILKLQIRMPSRIAPAAKASPRNPVIGETFYDRGLRG